MTFSCNSSLLFNTYDDFSGPEEIKLKIYNNVIN